MGVDARPKPPLPAPTTSPSAPADSTVSTDLATDVSHRTDRTSYSIPDDGSPITISTRPKRQDRGKDAEGNLTRGSHHSQTSLLIEYFGGGKGGSNVQSRPSVRVKVTPSAARKIQDTNEHIQISETGRSRQPSYTKRISLSPNVKGVKEVTESGDDRSLSSYASATEESVLQPRRPPVEIEVMRKDAGSPASGMSSPRDSRYIRPNPSEISSMPPDSVLETQETSRTPKRTRSRSQTRAEFRPTDTLKTPSRRRSRSLSKERITQKIVEKLVRNPVDSGSKHKRVSGSRSRSVSKDHVESPRSGRRRSSKSHREDELAGVAESSFANAQLSPSRRSGDQYSFVSGTSKSSINNPKLLETVEDAIKRLILPELQALKTEQKSSRHRSRFDESQRGSMASASTGSRDNSRRRISKTSSAPDVGKPKVVLNQDEYGGGLVLSGDSVKGRKERKSSREMTDSPSRHSPRDKDAEGKLHKHSSRDKHGLRDAAATGAAGALTAAALRHHDSRSSVDRRERRKKRSKSRSRSASLVEDTEFLRSDQVPPMPMSSDIHSSEVTRDSILTEHTERPNSPLVQDRQTPVREVSSPASRTPTRAAKNTIGTHHSNASRGDLSLHSAQSDRSLRSGDVSLKYEDQKLAAEAVNAALMAAKHSKAQEQAPVQSVRTHPGQGFSIGQNRSLSPIQSVASYRDDSTVEPANRESFPRTQSSQSLSSADQEYNRKHSAVSIESLSSSASSKLARARHAPGTGPGIRVSDVSQDSRPDSEFARDSPAPKDADMQYWYEQHKENDRHRSLESGSTRDPTVDYKHMTNYTDDSAEGNYLDQVAAGQQVRGIGANPEYRHTPVAVESAVASLLDASVVSGRSKGGDRSYPNSTDGYENEGHQQHGARQTSPSKSGERELRLDSVEPLSHGTFQQRTLQGQGAKAAAPSFDDDIALGASGLPMADSPMPEIGHGLDEDSEINTNPSIIQGPIGGVQHDNLDHWPYEPTPPQSDGNLLAGHRVGDRATASDSGRDRELSLDRDASVGDGLNKGASVDDLYGQGAERDISGLPETYPADGYGQGHALKDEGYISSANPRSPGAITPDARPKGGQGLFDNDGTPGFEEIGDDDPFVGKGHVRHMSGNSHGMASPLYDSATGKGLDRIQSKDIVALMDHLTVRDAQRNARDTEILVTLVRSAAEMRNSFEDMKRLLADHGDNIISATDRNTERSVHKAINGPRPQPLGTPRFPRRTSAEDEMLEDIPAKRKNVFKRALKGLSSRSTNDLAKIEDMLVQLLGDVEGLKTAQELRATTTQSNSLKSFDPLHVAPEGYEPEGHAGTGSTNLSNSGFFSNPPSRQASAMRGSDRRISEHRISTVPEGDEDLVAQQEAQVFGNEYDPDDQLLTPPHQQARGGSVPLDTPPQVFAPTGALSSESSPRAEKTRKHKTTSSSFIPKISRWSETTASTVANRFRTSGRKEREHEVPQSRSGSQLDLWDQNQHPGRVSDKLHSTYSLEGEAEGEAALPERTPSPLIPQEDPKYQAHRISLNLQHPQPRQGPTPRYQHQLESKAQAYGPSASPAEDQFGLGVNLNRFSEGSGRYSGGGHLSPISDTGYSDRSAADEVRGPPLPPKILEDPLVPQRSSKGSDVKPHYASPIRAVKAHENRYSNGSDSSQMNTSIRSASGHIMGPRPQSTSRRQRQGISQQTADTFGYGDREGEDRDGDGDRDHDDVTF
ncbi:MAG: hypothetical protein M1825_002421 [Sarcosagium campestre]|nr:MAG: hypothetical protein M1825_002421 [Sarcosagium campestre]